MSYHDSRKDVKCRPWRFHMPPILFSFAMALAATGVAQVLSFELLSSVPITPIQAGSSLNLSRSKLTAATAWRDKLFLYDSAAHRFLLIQPDSANDVMQTIDLPRELGRFTCLGHPQLLGEFQGISCAHLQATLQIFEVRGDGKGSYRVPTALVSKIDLRYPNGTSWRERVGQIAVSPMGDCFWVSSGEEKTSTSQKTWLWRFSIHRRGRTVSSAIVEEKLPFPEIPLAQSYSVGGLAWWPAGLLVALNVGSDVSQDRPSLKSAALVLLPWGQGQNPQVVVPRFARGHRVIALADTPSALHIVLQRLDDQTYAVASIPKLFPKPE